MFFYLFVHAVIYVFSDKFQALFSIFYQLQRLRPCVGGEHVAVPRPRLREKATVAKRVSVLCIQSHARPVCACVRVCMCCTCMGERRESGLCIRSHAQRVLVRVRVRVLVPVRRSQKVYVKAIHRPRCESHLRVCRKYPGRASV